MQTEHVCIIPIGIFCYLSALSKADNILTMVELKRGSVAVKSLSTPYQHEAGQRAAKSLIETTPSCLYETGSVTFVARKENAAYKLGSLSGLNKVFDWVCSIPVFVLQ